MSVAPPQIEKLLYPDMPGERSIRISEDGVAWHTYTIPSVQTVSDALAYWETQANAEATLSLTYAFGLTSSVCRFSASGSFWLDLQDSLPAALGYSASSYSGSDVYSGDTTAKAWCRPYNISYHALTVDEEVRLKRFRWGRRIVRKHYRSLKQRLDLAMSTADAEVLLAGPLFKARFRAFASADTAAAYGVDNVDGYHDIYPYAVTEPRQRGVARAHTMFSVLGTLGEV